MISAVICIFDMGILEIRILCPRGRDFPIRAPTVVRVTGQTASRRDFPSSRICRFKYTDGVSLNRDFPISGVAASATWETQAS